jgi:dolichol-phosphate mannosyltransferase
MKLDIIIPTLNERGSLPMLFSELENVNKTLNSKNQEMLVVIVDDDSNDGTQDYVEEYSKKNTLPIKLLKRKERGLATAVIKGFEETSDELVCVMDADLSHPPELIPKMIDLSKEYSIVLPCRNMLGGGAEEWPAHRKLTSMFATSLVRFIGIKVKDPMSGYFLMHRSVIDGVKLSPIGYKILLEILVKGNIKNYIETPYIFRNRTRGASKMNSKIIMLYLKHLMMLKKWKKENKNKLRN